MPGRMNLARFSMKKAPSMSVNFSHERYDHRGPEQ
jgi:hypothetical protein